MLNRGKGHEKCEGSNGWFDLAVKKESLITSEREGSILTNAANVAYCKGSTGQISFKTSDGKTNWINKYLFGWIKGDNAGVTFAIEKDKVLKNGKWQIESGVLRISEEEKTTLLNENFVKSLKKFNGKVGDLANTLRKDRGRLVFWGTIFSSKKESDRKIMCNEHEATENDWRCDWGIIDVFL